MGLDYPSACPRPNSSCGDYCENYTLAGLERQPYFPFSHLPQSTREKSSAAQAMLGFCMLKQVHTRHLYMLCGLLHLCVSDVKLGTHGYFSYISMYVFWVFACGSWQSSSVVVATTSWRLSLVFPHCLKNLVIRWLSQATRSNNRQ